MKKIEKMELGEPMTWNFSILEDKINEIIDFLNNSQQEEKEDLAFDDFLDNKYGGREEKKEQSSKPSIREQVEFILDRYFNEHIKIEDSADQILDLIKKEILNKIQPLRRLKNNGPWCLREDEIIKIINNL